MYICKKKKDRKKENKRNVQRNFKLIWPINVLHQEKNE